MQKENQEKKKQQEQGSIGDNRSNNSGNNGLLFPPSPAEIFNEQNTQQLDELIRSLQKRSSRNDQTSKQESNNTRE
jgi:hypothetical protein